MCTTRCTVSCRSTLTDRRWCQPSVVPSAMFMHVLPLWQINQPMLCYALHCYKADQNITTTTSLRCISVEVHLSPTIQNGIQFLYKVCMKLRREYIGNIILHLAEFGMKALDIWQSTHLLIFESPQMGLGGKDPGAGDEVELFKQ